MGVPDRNTYVLVAVENMKVGQKDRFGEGGRKVFKENINDLLKIRIIVDRFEYYFADAAKNTLDDKGVAVVLL